MKFACVLPVIFLIALAASALRSAQTQPSAEEDHWAPLRVFEGKWQGSTSGKPGTGTTTREYKFELNGHFLSQSDKSVYEPARPGGKPLVHEDFGMFSYDAAQQKIIWRQFHSEGFVNEYAMEFAGPDGKSLEFVTTRIENLPGFRAKKLYRVVSADEIEETFWLAPPDKDFEVYTMSHLQRMK